VISVIIPNYNYGRYLPDAVASVAKEADEIIVINDGCTDDSAELMDEFSLKYRGFRYKAHGQRMGMAQSRNEGLKISSGAFLVFLDADDMRISGSLRLQREYFSCHPEIDVLWGKALELRERVPFCDIAPLISKARVHPAEVNPQTVMYRRAVFEKYGGFYEKLMSGTDKEMCMRLGIHPESPFRERVKCKKLDNALAFYRKHPMQIHKLRKANSAWAKETKHIQKARLKELKRDGITKKNTVFPI
jgi:glycosyltransferase involved in cell wall biosynthesis